MSEIWIIDHSTTTAQAASHTGGNSGKGGDILYRWGNPATYNNGTVANQKLFGQHNAHWIEDSLPYANQIMVFNNGLNRTGGNYSTAEIINPPVVGYNYTATLPYLPTVDSWIYNAGNPNNYYAQNISSDQQLSNGNVLLCNGPSGVFTEVTSTGTQVWKYINPVSNTGIISQNTTPTQNSVFRATFYPSNFAGFAGNTLTSGTIIENTNSISASCNLTVGIKNNTEEYVFKLFPNPTSDYFTIVAPTSETSILDIELINSLGQIIISKKNVLPVTQHIFDIKNLPIGVYYLTIKSETKVFTQKLIKQ
jgi:hypothetical protein